MRLPWTINNQVIACNAFFAGDNSGVWSMGLWPHSWSLYVVGAQELSPGGKKIWRYQITDIGNTLSIGTFCHENGHMLCGYPDIYDYDYDSTGGSGNFSLMGYGGFDHNPVQIDAYLKRASGWATTTELDTVPPYWLPLPRSAGTNFNHFYRFQKPDVPTEYYLIENRQQSGRDARSRLPALPSGMWMSLGTRTTRTSTIIPLTPITKSRWSRLTTSGTFEHNVNAGDAQDLYYGATLLSAMSTHLLMSPPPAPAGGMAPFPASSSPISAPAPT